jgi:hypothetical protein
MTNFVSFELMRETFRRLSVGIYGGNPVPRWYKGPPPTGQPSLALVEASYCIDAPDAIPAGGWFRDSIEGEEFPSEITAWREADHA